MIKLSKEQATEIYRVLVKYCDAEDCEEDEIRFAEEFSKDNPGTEWRFIGNLGYGGKFYWPGMYVDYYSEDETKIRQSIARRTNRILKKMKADFLHGEG